jgi:hypothetical protein
MIKVAVIGTHGTRKTTLCHKLVAGLKEIEVNAEYLGEVAREAKQKGFEINERTTLEAQLWIFHTQIARELEFSVRPDVDVLVCDRGVIDNYMYLVKRFGYQQGIDEMVNLHTKTYTHLFRVPIRRNSLSEDSVRSIDPVFQREIDDLLKKELKQRGIPYQGYRSLRKTIEIITEGVKK